MLDNRLVRMINNERCFVLVGSGPSCEPGYPSWKKLANDTYKLLCDREVAKDKDSYEKYLQRKQYPELFQLAETDLGDRKELVSLVKSLLTKQPGKRGDIYDWLIKWPFACYLTTNYDDEIASRLAQAGYYFQTLRNKREDLYALREGASNLVVKLHSDLDHPDEVVLTSDDYRKLYVEDAGKYFRDKMRSVFEMFNVFIIGHSLSDPHLDYILQTAKQTASPTHPIFMIASEFSAADESEFLKKYNIVLQRYSNNDGTHSQLRRDLSVADKYITSRFARSNLKLHLDYPKEEAEAAAALFIFQRLQQVKNGEYLTRLVLYALAKAPKPGITLEELFQIEFLRSNSVNVLELQEALPRLLSELENQKLVKKNAELFSLTDTGIEGVKEVSAIREIERNQAFGQFVLSLKQSYPSLSSDEEGHVIQIAESAIVRVFDKRGLTIANGIFAGQSASPEELSDIFAYSSEAAASLQGNDLRASFIEAFRDFLISPTDNQAKYLAAVSQGYFLYHLAGLDPNCSRIRRDIFQRTLWLCDSSILLPLIAKGCHNHDYAVDLFTRLKKLGACVYTTHKLLQEASDHFTWAFDFVNRVQIDSPEFLSAALVKGNYKQNLFIDGYVRLAADGYAGAFSDYINILFPGGLKSNFLIEKLLITHDVNLINLDEFEGFKDIDRGDLEDKRNTVRTERERRGTFRSELQTDAEAEIWQMIEGLRAGKYAFPNTVATLERVYFVSQSRVLNHLSGGENITTWTPEAVYRYLSALPGEKIDPSLLQQCILHEYFYAGISFIDQQRYVKFFGPAINAARISFSKEKERYVEDIEGMSVQGLEKAFDETPDLEKPFFTSQMAWRQAERQRERADEALARAREAEAKLSQLEAEKRKEWKKREKRRQQQDQATQRNLQDPKHQRKRLRQAKKRSRKKKQ